MADDRPRKVERFETQRGGYRIITTVTTIHDPAAVKAAQEFQVRCLARRLPEILARLAAEAPGPDVPAPDERREPS